ncbi:MAG: imidazole glycerol phosphate synthase subunit HisH [Treponema sp.]|nr:imidazole glycerol phosphate synthase subunit HisH [Treponema sp.]
MTGIVDYNAGNICSVERSLSALQAPYLLSKNPSDLTECDRLIFPGVGDAAYAMEQLNKTGFDLFLKEWAHAGKPLMGICLGSQIIFDSSEEGNVTCLGLVPGTIKHFDSLIKQSGTSNTVELKIPHMGWNDLVYSNGGSSLLDGIPEHSDFYFVHSYVIQPVDSSIIKAYCNYGIQVPAVIEYNNISAFQFHPEKSGESGMRILRNYVQNDISQEVVAC